MLRIHLGFVQILHLRSILSNQIKVEVVLRPIGPIWLHLELAFEHIPLVDGVLPNLSKKKNTASIMNVRLGRGKIRVN